MTDLCEAEIRKKMVTETSKQAYESIQEELCERQKQVLDALFTIQPANNKLIANMLSLGINQVTARMVELRDMKLVTFSHEAPCPITQRNTMYWKTTKHGEMIAEKITKPTDILLIRPFIVEEMLNDTVYRAQIKSKGQDKFYDTQFIRKWDNDLKQFYYDKSCTCQGFYYRQECSHCEKLQSELIKWGEE